MSTDPKTWENDWNALRSCYLGAVIKEDNLEPIAETMTSFIRQVEAKAREQGGIEAIKMIGTKEGWEEDILFVEPII